MSAKINHRDISAGHIAHGAAQPQLLAIVSVTGTGTKVAGEFYWPDQLTARERSVAMKTRPEFNPARLAK